MASFHLVDGSRESVASESGAERMFERCSAMYDAWVEPLPEAPSSPRAGARRLPLSVPSERRELFGRLFDPEHMRAVFQRELSTRSSRALRVTSCDVQPGRTEKAYWKGQLKLIYTLGIEVGLAAPREVLLLGVAPVEPGFPGREIEERCRKLSGHPAVAPFREPALHLPDLELGLFLFPLDPALPGLAAITGSDGAELLSTHLPECRAGARVERIECELQHYKPFNRAVLRVRARLSDPGGSASERSVYVKAFYGDRGAVSHRELVSLWHVAQRSSFLRVPEPLGYDPEHRLLVMGEAPGARSLSEWVRCIKHGRPLPAGVDAGRLDRCVRVAVQALSELQCSGLRPEESYTFNDELAHLKRERNLLGQEVRAAYRGAMARFEALMRRLEALTPVDETLVPSHGEYRHQQLVGDERSMTLIDWDSFCAANPALDASRWLARLHRDSLEGPGSIPGIEQLADSFRREFLALRPEAAVHLDLYEALQLTKHVLHGFGRESSGDDLSRMERLAEAAERRLERVETAPRG